MSEDELQREIEKLKNESKKQKEIIYDLEKSNNEKVDMINSQKVKVTDL